MSLLPLGVVALGQRRYRPVLQLQRDLVQARLAGTLDRDLLLLVEHPPVVTFGRGTRSTSVPLPTEVLEARGYEVADVERGGDVTVHAPGQLVGYPILDLTTHRRDLHWYLRSLEEALIMTLDGLGLGAGRREGLTGVWVGDRKIASIGVHVKRWVTLHGFALNVTTDLALFDVVVPCGIPGVVMTSVARELDRPAQGQGSPEPSPALWSRTVAGLVAAFGVVLSRHAEALSPDSLPVNPAIVTAANPAGG